MCHCDISQKGDDTCYTALTADNSSWVAKYCLSAYWCSEPCTWSAPRVNLLPSWCRNMSTRYSVSLKTCSRVRPIGLHQWQPRCGRAHLNLGHTRAKMVQPIDLSSLTYLLNWVMTSGVGFTVIRLVVWRRAHDAHALLTINPNLFTFMQIMNFFFF